MKTISSTLLFLLLTATTYGSVSNDSLMKVLKLELSKKSIYDRQKNIEINKLKSSLAACSPSDHKEQYILCTSLYNEYFNFQYDSAYVYTRRLLSISNRMHDMPRQYDSKIKLGLILISSGMFKETFDCLNDVNSKLLTDDSKLLYYELKYRVYKALSEYNSDTFYSRYDAAESVKYLDTAITLAKPNSFEHLIDIAQLPANHAGLPGPKYKYYEYLLYKRNLTPHQVAMVATGLSSYYYGENKLKLLLIAAINDVRTSTKETLAIFRLGKELDKKGDIVNAYTFLQEAMNNAQFYGSRLHKVEIASVLPYVAAKKLLVTEKEKNQMVIYLFSAFIISVIIVHIPINLTPFRQF
ncbi:hypothetical protein GJU39_23120 [Pedobacter petrophilus]|uniref:DUF6377 domain-containing protein n=1 Tax=Pedobacter petrophilus TaxID=1908241 RepID=A0A7K0G577_9SPHI|nr:DUF6377 domain-containing protein [Pedobacter petrophilus]MRX78958.1 hypothetical protein [Pedobacter petrophilus]